jgi:hypothetical protein
LQCIKWFWWCHVSSLVLFTFHFIFFCMVPQWGDWCFYAWLLLVKCSLKTHLYLCFKKFNYYFFFFLLKFKFFLYFKSFWCTEIKNNF